MRRAWEGARRDDSRPAGPPHGLLLPAVMRYGPQLMSCMCARTCRICWLQEKSYVPSVNVVEKSHGQISETGAERQVEDRDFVLLKG